MLDLVLKPTWVVYPLINIEANSNYDGEKPIDDDEFEIKHLFEIDASNSSINLHFGFAMPEQPGRNLEYFINIKLFATFAINKDLHTVNREIAREVILDIVNLALGGIRELIAMTTSRGPWGPYMLPFMDADGIANNILNEVFGSSQTPTKSKRRKPI